MKIGMLVIIPLILTIFMETLHASPSQAFKAIILGKSATGKSSLIAKMRGDKPTYGNPSTQSVKITGVYAGINQDEIYLWDTNPIPNISYYQPSIIDASSGVILLYKITKTPHDSKYNPKHTVTFREKKTYKAQKESDHSDHLDCMEISGLDEIRSWIDFFSYSYDSDRPIPVFIIANVEKPLLAKKAAILSTRIKEDLKKEYSAVIESGKIRLKFLTVELFSDQPSGKDILNEFYEFLLNTRSYSYS